MKKKKEWKSLDIQNRECFNINPAEIKVLRNLKRFIVKEIQ